MGDPAAPPLDLARILHALADHQVDYVLVGGSAAVAGHGAQRATTDVDICVRWTDDNLENVSAALRHLDAGLRADGLDETLAVPHLDRRMLAGMELSTWRTAAGDVDILRGIPVRGLKNLAFYDELASRSEQITLLGTPVKIASINDLIASKEGINRPTDREALPELRALRDQPLQQDRQTTGETSSNPDPPLRASDIVERSTDAAYPRSIDASRIKSQGPSVRGDSDHAPTRNASASFELD